MATRKTGSKRAPAKASYGPLAAKILDRWQGAGGDIVLDRIVSELGDVPRYDVVAALKELQKAGAGEFLVGRGGQKPSFVWNARARLESAPKRAESAPQRAPAARANSQPETPPAKSSTRAAAPNTSAAAGAPRTLEHMFYVRPGYAAAIRLPEDVTRAEIDRLCRYLETLPFEAPSGAPNA